jgi:hypothetical protein
MIFYYLQRDKKTKWKGISRPLAAGPNWLRSMQKESGKRLKVNKIINTLCCALPGSRVKKISDPDPHPHFKPKIVFLSSRKYVLSLNCSFDADLDLTSIVIVI